MKVRVFNFFIALCVLSGFIAVAQPQERMVDLDSIVKSTEISLNKSLSELKPVLQATVLQLRNTRILEERMDLDSLSNQLRELRVERLKINPDNRIEAAIERIRPLILREKIDELGDLDEKGSVNRSLSDPFLNDFKLEKVQPSDAAIEKSKVIIKTYAIDANDKLILNNQYGNIRVVTSSKNEFRVQIEIKAFETSENMAQELLDNVTINESKQSNTISLTTKIAKGNSVNFWIRRAGNNEERRGLQINYTVYMPSKNALDITNRYGAITLPDFEGLTNIFSSYGSFKADDLSNPGNKIKVMYGSADIKSLNSGNIDISYGSINLASAEKLDATIEYSTGKIGSLSGNGDLNLRYCSGFKISGIDSKSLNVNSEYSTVSMQFIPDANFDFDVTASYSEFKNRNDRGSIESKTGESSRGFNPTKNYKGHVGRGSEGKVIIRTSYGSVLFL